MTTNRDIIEAIETLGASFPWDIVDLWIVRRPEGQIEFSAILNANDKFGWRFASESADAPMEAVKRICESEQGKRNPETDRAKRIAELKEQIRKLEAVVLGMPPYRPNTELCAVNPIEVPETIDVSSQVADWEQDVKDNPPQRVI